MSRSRLAIIAADLDAAIGRLEAPRVALLAIRAALGAHPSAEKPVSDALQCLETDDRNSARAHRVDVAAVVERLDEQYLALYAAAGEVNTPAVVTAFSRARAVAALEAALGPDEKMAAKEAVYEAHAALEDGAGEALLASIRRAIETKA
jgi:hypothetical protein